MQAVNRKYSALVEGAKQFVIPVFQRDYSWTEDQCQQLWDDVMRVGSRNSGDHFLGPIVYIATEDQGAAFTKWLLIDGQQRMTSITLLIAALRDKMRASKASLGKDDPTTDQLDAYFLKNSLEQGERRAKLVLRERDEATLRWIVDNTEEPSEKSAAIEQSYNFFRAMINTVSVAQVYQGVGQLDIVDVTLKRSEDDPQRIFESLNSTGVDLSQADLVRNYVLMGLEEDLQTKFYQEYWRKIERSLGKSANKFDDFIRDFIALKTQARKQGRLDQVYVSFRSEFRRERQDTNRLEKLLHEMSKLAQYHAAFSVGTDDFDQVKEALERVRSLSTSPAILVMRLLDVHKQGRLSIQQLRESLLTIESYLVRRAVCGLRTNSYWQHFADAAYRLDPDDALTSLKISLARLPSTYSFPRDGEFQYALEEVDLYSRNICRFVLDQLENPPESAEQNDLSKYSIEHVMPQNDDPSNEWKSMLGSSWKDIQETWLHRLGNLTLTAYNQKYSDKPFWEKKTMKDGFNHSPLRLNMFIRDQSQWTATQMEQRGKELAQSALRNWPMLKVDDAVVEEAKAADLRKLAEQRDIESVRQDMDDVARKLFDALRAKVLALDSEMIELPHSKSVSYHNPEFALEAIPRTRWVLVLLNLAHDRVSDSEGVVQSASQYKFFSHAQHDADSFVNIESVEDIEACMPFVQQALATSAD